MRKHPLYLPLWGRGTTEWWMRFMDGNVFAFGKDICTCGWR